MVNGVSDTKARPSWRSSSSRGSTSGRSAAGETSKWRNASSCQRWYPTTTAPGARRALVEDGGALRLARKVPPRLVLHELGEGPLDLEAELRQPVAADELPGAGEQDRLLLLDVAG